MKINGQLLEEVMKISAHEEIVKRVAHKRYEATGASAEENWSWAEQVTKTYLDKMSLYKAKCNIKNLADWIYEINSGEPHVLIKENGNYRIANPHSFGVNHDGPHTRLIPIPSADPIKPEDLEAVFPPFNYEQGNWITGAGHPSKQDGLKGAGGPVGDVFLVAKILAKKHEAKYALFSTKDEKEAHNPGSVYEYEQGKIELFK